MKKLIALLLALVMVIAMVACGNANAPEQTDAPAKETEAPAKDTEAPAADATEAPKPTEKITTNFSESGWPENEHTEKVPEPEKATIKSAIDGGGKRWTIMMTMTLEDAQEYVQQLYDAGFEGDLASMDSNHSYVGKTADGWSISFTWRSEAQVILGIQAPA